MDLTTIPLEDWFQTTLWQEWNGQAGTMFVNSVPNFTFPVWETTYVIVNPTTTPQLAEIDSYNPVNNSVNVVNVTGLELWNGVPSVEINHATQSPVIISDNFEFWKKIKSSINSKINKDTWETQVYADETARDTAIPSPANWMQVYVTSLWSFTDYQGWAWVTRATWSTPNASETVAGKVEIATQAEFDWGTDTGWTGAFNVAKPSDIQNALRSSVVWITGELKIWTTNTAPIDWLIADWNAVSRITYANLFAVIWTNYGIWDWSTTFNLPNFQGRVPVGRDTLDTDFDTIGETGGIKEDDHNHSYTIPQNWYAVDTGTATVWYNGIIRTTNSWFGASNQNGNRNLTTGNHITSVVQPYQVINYIIKT